MWEIFLIIDDEITKIVNILVGEQMLMILQAYQIPMIRGTFNGAALTRFIL